MKKAARAIPNRQLRQERELRCWSQLEVADQIGTTSFNVSRWERGITFPTAHFRQELCALFGKSAVELGFLQDDDSHKSLLPHSLPTGQDVVSLPPQTARIAEERKLVTFLLADMTESTELGETLDPEDLHALMGRYYAHARRVIESYGGTLEPLIGSTMTAAFGLPHAHSDDAERALAAALRLREAVAIDSLPGGNLLLRTGISTGVVIATNNPSGGAFLLTGDAVNTAARLQQAASFGEILVSERTAAATQAAFLFHDARLVEVKGKRHPLRAFPLWQARTLRQVERPALVGRQPDLRQLELLGERALMERRPQLVSIVAPAGTGKTRLLEEFLAHLELAEGFQVAVARCPPYGQTLIYWPLRGLLSGLLGEASGKPPVVEAFVRGGQTLEDASRLADLVLTTLGVEQEEVADRESIFAAWRLLLESLALKAPRIVVFEDLHWASESLLDLVEYIMHLHVQSSLLVIVLSRPELLDRRPTWGGGQQNFTAVTLQPLSEVQTRELVRHVAMELNEALQERVVDRSGGNPFFALELIHGLVENSATVGVLPDTVHAAVLARLDMLSSHERMIAQAASVAGRVFRVAALRAVLEGLTTSEFDRALDGLMTRHLVAQTSGWGFTFQHVLIRDVAYGSLSRSERVRLHSAIAAWFEAFEAGGLDEFTELIAYHYREAVKLTRQSAIPLPVDLTRVVRALERASLLASRSGALAEARAYLQSAIELAEEREHLRLYEQLGDALLQGHSAVDAYRKAIESWRGTADQDPLVGGRLLRKLLMAYTRWNAWDVQARPTQEELNEVLIEAQRLAETSGDEDERWRVRLARIRLLVWSGNSTLQEAEEGRGLSLAIAAYFEERNDLISYREALNGYIALSYRVDADHDALEASQLRLSISDLPLVERADALQVMAATLLNLGNYSRCIEVVREALTQLRPGEPVVHFDAAIAFAMWALLYGGRWSEISDFRSALENIWEQIQHGVGANTHVAGSYLCLLHIALARENSSEVDAAISVLEQCFSSEQVNARALLAAYREDDPRHLNFESTSDEWTIPMLMFFNDRGISAPRALIARLRALISTLPIDSLIRIVEIAEALEHEDDVRLSAAIEGAEAHGAIAHAARMRLVLARRTGDLTQLDRTRPILEQLGDRQFLRRLARATNELVTKADPRHTF
ncbi:MAG TPA: adenylate/guanylate cyclase domain-containing protein [Ktedonobacteraceae bacterium]|nr:adenylate/guanylate cyclase domain-containing protein [Ktedonobacteraceae bacterium]